MPFSTNADEVEYKAYGPISINALTDLLNVPKYMRIYTTPVRTISWLCQSPLHFQGRLSSDYPEKVNLFT